MQFGFKFEEKVFEQLQYLFGNKFEKGNELEDRDEGTDCWVHGYRVDVTTNPAKPYTEWFYNDHKFAFGVRRRNSKREFEEPVLVFCINTWNQMRIVNEIDEHFFMEALMGFDKIAFEE